MNASEQLYSRFIRRVLIDQFAAHGEIEDGLAQLLDLVGAVNMYHDNGFEIHTQKAEIEMNVGNASGSVPVDGQGPFGTIKSDSGFELEDKGAVIRFLGNAKMVIFDSALKGKS